MQLSGNTILITGGGSGIGQGLAVALAQLDNTVIVCGRRQSALDETRALHDRIHSYRCDISKPDDIDQLVNQLKTDGHNVNVLINNAAILNHYHLGKAERFDREMACTELNTNLQAPILLTMALQPMLAAAPSPRIINVGSPGGIVAISTSPLYSASKAGLHAFTQVLRLHLKDSIQVVEVFPPTVETAMTHEIHRPKSGVTACVDAILKGLERNQNEIWVGEGKVVRWMMNLLPPSWVFKLVNSQSSMHPQ